MLRRTRRFVVPSSGLALLGAVVVIAACSGAPAAPAAPPASPLPSATSDAPTPPGQSSAGSAAADWPTFGHDAGRSGVAPSFPNISHPAIAWQKSLDGAVYGQPIVVGDTVFAATENNTVYALAATNGAVRWSKHLGTPVHQSELPCGNIDPLGITGTMAHDPATGGVFVVAETTGGHHTLYGLDAGTGAITQQRAVEPPKGDLIAHQQRSALTVLGGRVYIAYGGLAGDCAHYIGSVVAAPTSGNAANINYAIPTSREGGIWAPGGGVVVGSGAAARLLYASGNGESTGGYDGSDSVISLDANLRLTDRFSPGTWSEDNSQDLDLGSMTPAVVGSFVYADGKRGAGYVLRANHFGGIGGNVSQADVCPAFGSAAVSGDTVYVPCADGGTKAIKIGSDGKITTLWQANVPANGSPMLGGGSVWVTDWRGGMLYLLDPATGKSRAQVHLGDLPHFASPTLAHGQVYVGTMSGIVALK